MRIAESELIINQDGSVFHLHIRPEQLADKVILVGDPERIAMFRQFYDKIECEGASREFAWITGTRCNERISVLSTGIGTDNIDIVMTELDALANIDFNTREVKPEHKTLRVVRIGTCGAIQPDIPLGSYILSHYSIGFDGLMNWYANREKIADEAMEDAFVKHMNWDRHLPAPYFVKASQELTELLQDFTVRGMTISSPGFYGPQGRVVRQGLVMPDLQEKVESFRFSDRRITNFEMESSALAGMAGQLGHEAITVCLVIANRHIHTANTGYKASMPELIEKVMDRLCGKK